MDEHALSDGRSDDAAVGTALLMADLEAAIASASEEIAVLRGVADGMPRARPALPNRAEAPPVAAVPDVTVASERTLVSVHGHESRDAAVPVAAPSLPVDKAGVATVASLDRKAAVDRSPDLPAIVAPPATTPVPWPVQAADGVPVRPAGLAWSETAAPALTSLAESVAPAIASPSAVRRDETGAEWTWPVPVGVAPSIEPADVTANVTATTPIFEQAVGRPAAPVGTSLADRPASASPGSGSDRDVSGIGRDKGEPAGGSHNGPTEGDVFLDGERVGRWMARHLARELGGPAASGTAFDPKIGPAWPGALHGN